MKIVINVREPKSGRVWNEEYEINNGVDPDTYAKDLIRRFNNTLYPHELPREVMSVSVTEEVTNILHDHSWIKVNSFTIINSSGNYDIMRCERCGVTGKRHGIGGEIRRDSIFKGKCYAKCETALAQIQKNTQRITGGGI